MISVMFRHLRSFIGKLIYCRFEEKNELRKDHMPLRLLISHSNLAHQNCNQYGYHN